MTSILRVKGSNVVDGDGNEVILRGTSTGGDLNMENFITGFPGHEKKHRAAMLQVLGKEKYDFFFAKFHEYFFTSSDAKLLKKLGLNCLRIPINYHHFFDDMDPDTFKPDGLKMLDRVINICAKEEIYTIIDLHAVPGGQNPDWHSDNATSESLFWEFKVFQDQVIALWEKIAAHYKGNSWVAGYNLLNEPCDEQHVRLVAYYERIEKAVRAIDPDHILWLDGNTFAADLTHFKEPLPNTVYAIHDYSNYGFPGGETYISSPEQRSKLARSYERKVAYMKKYNIPVWNGEFGPVYANEHQDGSKFRDINRARFLCLRDQLEIYDKEKCAWTIWLWKDIGFQGMVHAAPDSPWKKLLQPWLDRKRSLALDAWGADETDVRDVFQPLEDWVFKNVPSINDKYPTTWMGPRHISRALRQTLMSDALQLEFAKNFEGKSFDELDALAASFKLENCIQRDELNRLLMEHAKVQ